MRTSQSSSKYRPEIDGLRAFAVTAVIINHFNKNLLPSGYLGVDIFFVISGYVITSSLADRQSEDFLDFASGFYERRIKRLVPALVVFVLATSALISLFNPDPSGALDLGWRSLFGISNISLYQESTDYFAQSTELNPFTHTWSLGVEEQFYLLFPLLIWFSGFGQQKAQGARNLFLWVGILTLASLISFMTLYRVDQPAAYFLMPPRFWEMASGCLIFIGFQRRAKLEQALEQIPPLVALAGMVAVMLLPARAAVPATVAIVLLSAVLIASLKQGTSAYQLFTIKKIIYVGTISYSLYLWHWGVLCISRWTIGIHWWSAPFQISLMILVATASYYFVERPLRSKSFGSRGTALRLGAATLGTTASAVFAGGQLIGGRLYAGNYPYENLTTRSRNQTQGSFYTGTNCHLRKSADNLPSGCEIAGSTHQTFYFLGNSHTDHYRETHFLLNKNLRVGIDGISVSSCVFPPDPTQSYCGAAQKKQEERVIAALRAGDVAVVSNRYPITEDRNGWMKTRSSVDSLNTFASRVLGKGGAVILFGPLPEFQIEARECIRLWFRPFPPTECETTVKTMKAKRSSSRQLMTHLDNRILVFAPMQYVCPGGRCGLIDKDGKPLFVDEGHLTDYANRRYIYPNFKAFLLSSHLIQPQSSGETGNHPRLSSH